MEKDDLLKTSIQAQSGTEPSNTPTQNTKTNGGGLSANTQTIVTQLMNCQGEEQILEFLEQSFQQGKSQELKEAWIYFLRGDDPKAKDLAATTGQFLTNKATSQNQAIHANPNKQDGTYQKYSNISTTGVGITSSPGGVLPGAGTPTLDHQATIEINLYALHLTNARKALSELVTNQQINTAKLKEFLNAIMKLTVFSIDPQSFFPPQEDSEQDDPGLGLNGLIRGLSKDQRQNLLETLQKVKRTNSERFNKFMALLVHTTQSANESSPLQDLVNNLNQDTDIKEFLDNLSPIIFQLIEGGANPIQLFDSLNLESLISALSDNQKATIVSHFEPPADAGPEKELEILWKEITDAKENNNRDKLLSESKNYFSALVRVTAHRTIKNTEDSVLGMSFCEPSKPATPVVDAPANIGTIIDRNSVITALLSPEINPIGSEGVIKEFLDQLHTGRALEGFPASNVTTIMQICKSRDWDLNKQIVDELVYLFLMIDGFREAVSFFNKETEKLIKKISPQKAKSFHHSAQEFEQSISLFTKSNKGLVPKIDLKDANAIEQYRTQVYHSIEAYQKYLGNLHKSIKKLVKKKGDNAHTLSRLTGYFSCMISKDEGYINIFNKNLDHMMFLKAEYEKEKRFNIGYMAGGIVPQLLSSKLLTYTEALDGITYEKSNDPSKPARQNVMGAIEKYQKLVNQKSDQELMQFMKDFSEDSIHKLIYGMIRRQFIKLFRDEINHYNNKNKGSAEELVAEQDYDLQAELQRITKFADLEFMKEGNLISAAIEKHFYGSEVPLKLAKQLIDEGLIPKPATPDHKLAETLDFTKSLSGIPKEVLQKRDIDDKKSPEANDEEPQDLFLQSVSDLKIADLGITKEGSGKSKVGASKKERKTQALKHTKKSKKKQKKQTPVALYITIPIALVLLAVGVVLSGSDSERKRIVDPSSKTKKAESSQKNKKYNSNTKKTNKKEEVQQDIKPKPKEQFMLERAKKTYTKHITSRGLKVNNFIPYKMVSTIDKGLSMDWLYIKNTSPYKEHKRLGDLVIRIESSDGLIDRSKLFTNVTHSVLNGNITDNYQVANTDLQNIILKDQNGTPFRYAEMLFITVVHGKGEENKTKYRYTFPNYINRQTNTADPIAHIILKNHNKEQGKIVFDPNFKWRPIAGKDENGKKTHHHNGKIIKISPSQSTIIEGKKDAFPFYDKLVK